jgi:hypothetical protein
MSQPALNTAAAAIARVRAWAAANRWSKSRYAKRAGLVDTTLRHFHDDDWNPTKETIEALERAIPTSWQDGDPIPRHSEACSEAVS